MTTLFKRENLTCTKDGDHIIMEGGKFGTHTIYCPSWDSQSPARTQAHWKGYCENNGINTGNFNSYDDIDESIPAIAKDDDDIENESQYQLEAGDYFPLFINQGEREATILGTIDDMAIAEYEMPAGTTALQLIPRDGSQTWGKSISYSTCPKKWLQAIREGEGGWEGNSQTRGYIDFPEEA